MKKLKIMWGVITMNFNQNDMRGEVDKAINIHAMKMGHQIMLCKTKKIANEKQFIFLWPSKGEYTDNRIVFEKKYKNDLNRYGSVFLLSDVGSRYENNENNKISNNVQKSKTIVTVDYIKIRPNRKMFEELRACGEFSLWDIDYGPMRYFRSKNGELRNKGYIAIYRAYKLPNGTNVRRSDLPKKTGYIPSLTESSFERISDSIINSNKLEPVEAVKIDNVDDVLRTSFIKGDFFEARKKKIMAIIEEYRL